MPTNQRKVNILYALNASNDEPIHRITKILLLAGGGGHDNLAIEVHEPGRNFTSVSPILLSFARMPRSEERGMNGEESPPKL